MGAKIVNIVITEHCADCLKEEKMLACWSHFPLGRRTTSLATVLLVPMIIWSAISITVLGSACSSSSPPLSSWLSTSYRLNI